MTAHRPRVAVVREQLEDREVANYLPLASDHDVRLVTTVQAGPYSATGLGLPVRRLPSRAQLMWPGRRVGRRLLGQRLDLEHVPRLDRAVAGADVVIVNETHLATSAQACHARRTGGPPVVVVSYENIPFRYEEDGRLLARKRLVRDAADAFVAMTPEVVEALVHEGVARDRVHLVTYGVDPARFTPRRRDSGLRRGWGIEDHRTTLLYAGRLLKEKGLLPLLLALAGCPEPRPVLVLVGSGPEQPRLEEAARALGVASDVRWLPWVDADEVPAIVASTDVFVMPSLPTPYWEEQLGFSMIEAMASAVPVAAVASGSIPYVLGEGGLLALPYDVAGLTGVLERLIHDPELRARLGRSGRNRVETTLCTRTAAAGIADVLGRVLRLDRGPN